LNVSDQDSVLEKNSHGYPGYTAEPQVSLLINKKNPKMFVFGIHIALSEYYESESKYNFWNIKVGQRKQDKW